MGTAVWQPKWWTKDQHESNWERVKDALKRDWEQTKVDLKGQGSDLDQDVDDTVKQAVGKDVIPPMGQANVPGGTPAVDTKSRKWDDVESPFKYGVGARHQLLVDGHALLGLQVEGDRLLAPVGVQVQERDALLQQMRGVTVSQRVRRGLLR